MLQVNVIDVGKQDKDDHDHNDGAEEFAAAGDPFNSSVIGCIGNQQDHQQNNEFLGRLRQQHNINKV
ncbi:hypothetical protein D3C80_2062420 [compost metagenome]